MRTGTNMVYVPYRGAAPSMNALVSGEVDLSLLVIPLVLPHADAGKLRILAITSKNRMVLLPDTPT